MDSLNFSNKKQRGRPRLINEENYFDKFPVIQNKKYLEFINRYKSLFLFSPQNKENIIGFLKQCDLNLNFLFNDRKKIKFWIFWLEKIFQPWRQIFCILLKMNKKRENQTRNPINSKSRQILNITKTYIMQTLFQFTKETNMF